MSYSKSHSKATELRNPTQPSSQSFLLSALAVLLVLAGTFFGATIFQPKPHAAATVIAVATSIPAAPAAEFGRWAIVSQPLFLLLGWFHNHVVANWGWAIVGLTLLINFVLVPTRWMSLKSTLKMQRIQPGINAIKDSYKDCSLTDPRRQEMQRKIVELQKSEGVNLLGGCLPTLLTYPILFGFYRMLSATGELHGARWLWIQSLSAPDPLHILPLLVVITMGLSQFLTPAPGVDPQQQRLMALAMPLVFGILTLKYAAALALYCLCSNIFTILQQMAFYTTAPGRELRALTKRAESLLTSSAPRE